MLTTRIITAAVLVALVLVCLLWLPSWAMALAFGAAWTVGALEWGRLVGWPRAGVRLYAAVLVALGLVGGAWFDASGAWAFAWVAAGWWIAALVSVVAYPWPVPSAFVAAAGILALVPSWFLLAYAHNSSPRGPVLVLSLLCVVWAADVGAYFFGRAFGRAKLAPAVSPGKTWAGVVGGVGAAILAGVAAAALLRLPVLSWALIAAATAGASIVGDLTVSLCKRRAGTKDSGHLLPGHGGILDRIDSLTAAVPVYILGLSFTGVLAT